MFDFVKDFAAKSGASFQSVSLFHEDTAYGTDSAKVQERLAKERGFRVLEHIAYKGQTTSLTAEVQRLKAANADVLMPSSYTSDTFLLLRTARDLDYNPRLIVAQNAGFTDPTFGPSGNPLEALSSLWYHDHHLDFTAQNVYKGMFGCYTLFDDKDTGDETTGLRLPGGQYDVPIFFNDWLFDQNCQLVFDLFNLDGILGDRFAANGVIQPSADDPRIKLKKTYYEANQQYPRKITI